jgi:hypothetical protein
VFRLVCCLSAELRKLVLQGADALLHQQHMPDFRFMDGEPHTSIPPSVCPTEIGLYKWEDEHRHIDAQTDKQSIMDITHVVVGTIIAHRLVDGADAPKSDTPLIWLTGFYWLRIVPDICVTTNQLIRPCCYDALVFTRKIKGRQSLKLVFCFHGNNL